MNIRRRYPEINPDATKISQVFLSDKIDIAIKDKKKEEEKVI